MHTLSKKFKSNKKVPTNALNMIMAVIVRIIEKYCIYDTNRIFAILLALLQAKWNFNFISRDHS
jgi:hypothetical protein